MQKHKRFALLASMLAAALLLTVCGGQQAFAENNRTTPEFIENISSSQIADNKAATVEGRWTSAEFAENSGMSQLADGKDVVFEFTKDGKMLWTIDGKDLIEIVLEKMKAAGLPEDQIAQASKQAPSGTYKADGNKITMTFKFGEIEESDTGDFKVEGDKLTVSMPGSEPAVFTRVK